MSVSVVIPAHNQRSFIEQSIGSVLSQEGPVREVLVVNDGSTDGNYEELARLDPRIRVLRVEQGGVSRARNLGAASTDSEFLAFLDADDVWLPGLLQRQVRHLAAHPMTAAVFSQCIWWYPEGEGEGEEPRWRVPDLEPDPGGLCPARRLSYLEILSRPGLPGHMCTLLIRRNAFLSLGGFDERRSYGEDIELAIRLSHDFPFDLLECYGMLYRRHPRSATAQLQVPNHMTDLISEAAARFGMVDAMGRSIEPRTLTRVLARAHFEHGHRHFWTGSSSVAMREFARSLRRAPRATAAAFLVASALPGGRSIAGALRRAFGRDQKRHVVPAPRPHHLDQALSRVSAPRQSAPPLRVGLLMGSTDCPGWLARGVSLAVAGGMARVVLVIERTSPETSRTPGRQWWPRTRRLLFSLVSWLDRRRADLPRPLPAVSLEHLAPAASRLRIGSPGQQGAPGLSDTELAALRAARLDVLVDGGFHPLPGHLAATARFGIVGFHDTGGRMLGANTVGAWEVLADDPTTTLALHQITTEHVSGRVLARAARTTERFSFHRNHVHTVAGAPVMLLRTLDRLWRGESPEQHTASAEGQPARVQLYPAGDPSNHAMATRLPRVLTRYLRRRIRKRRQRESWTVAWHWSDTPVHGVPNQNFKTFVPFTLPAGGMYADPFVVEWGDRHWVFMEEMAAEGGNGRIAVMEMTESGPVSAPQVILAEPWHLSFPSVFRDGDDWYLLTEASQTERVALYRARRFPFEWEPSHVLLEGFALVDPYLHRQGDTWFLFCSPFGNGIMPDEELFLFWADRLDGPYHPHPCNPLVTDVTRARMAGRIFGRDGKLFRPAQNGSPHYGASMTLQEIVTLSRTEYQEKTVAQFAPSWDPSLIGMHTINADGRLTVIDLLHQRPV